MEENKKEISNRKAIIAIITVIVLLVILGTVYLCIFRSEKEECKNTIQKSNNSTENVIQESNDSNENANVIVKEEIKIRRPVDTVLKPIIYLYPEQETEVTVKVGNPQNLTHTYPKYNDEWKVKAKPNGDLIDIKTGRNLYALYWEGINTVEPNMEEGFIVKGEDTIKFLEEKLEILGLNEREAEEFIVYWLPRLESNKYNYIRFQTEEEINNNMPLEITPVPDTIIRVAMEFKALEKPIEIKEQKLISPERTGYTFVEWGGTEIK